MEAHEIIGALLLVAIAVMAALLVVSFAKLLYELLISFVYFGIQFSLCKLICKMLDSQQPLVERWTKEYQALVLLMPLPRLVGLLIVTIVGSLLLVARLRAEKKDPGKPAKEPTPLRKAIQWLQRRLWYAVQFAVLMSLWDGYSASAWNFWTLWVSFIKPIPSVSSGNATTVLPVVNETIITTTNETYAVVKWEPPSSISSFSLLSSTAAGLGMEWLSSMFYRVIVNRTLV